MDIHLILLLIHSCQYYLEMDHLLSVCKRLMVHSQNMLMTQCSKNNGFFGIISIGTQYAPCCSTMVHPKTQSFLNKSSGIEEGKLTDWSLPFSSDFLVLYVELEPFIKRREKDNGRKQVKRVSGRATLCCVYTTYKPRTNATFTISHNKVICSQPTIYSLL